MKKNIILVPTDFTKVADCALSHAVKLAESYKSEIVLLHVVSKQSEVETARTKVEATAKKVSQESGIVIIPNVRVGNIFDDIGDAASEMNAKIILMGTHGARGMQKITGSYALKVITNSEVPFIVVQEKGIKDTGYDDIVVPIDLAKETKQKLKYASELAKHFNSKIHLIVPNESDEYFVNQLKRNIIFAKKYLAENGINSTTKVAESGNFVKEVIKFAASIDADLISIMNLQNEGMSGLFGGGSEQQIITNEAQIPVMCVNPKSTSVSRGLFS